MAGYELPVTRVPGLGSMDQIGAALGTGAATDYLGNIITIHCHCDLSLLSQVEPLVQGQLPAPAWPLQCPCPPASSSPQGRAADPCPRLWFRYGERKLRPWYRSDNKQLYCLVTIPTAAWMRRSVTDGPHHSNTVSIKPLIVSSVSGDLTNCLTSQPRHPEAPLSLASPGRAELWLGPGILASVLKWFQSHDIWTHISKKWAVDMTWMCLIHHSPV